MKRLRFYGASDDLVEVEGDVPGADEYPSVKEVFEVCGLRVTVELEPQGCWSVKVTQIDEDVAVTAENIALSLNDRYPDREPGGGYPEPYSMQLDMDVPDNAHVTRVKVDEAD